MACRKRGRLGLEPVCDDLELVVVYPLEASPPDDFLIKIVMELVGKSA